MKKRFTEEQIIGFQHETEAGLRITVMCSRYGLTAASYYFCAASSPECAS